MAPSKTFNTPGLNCALAIIEDERLRARFRRGREGIVPHPNALGYAACLAAYRDCQDWRHAVIDYLRKNRDLVQHFVNNATADLSMDEVQATYLAWINVSKLGLAEPARFFEEHGVGLSDGRHFRGEGRVRLNFGCPRERLLEALRRLQRVVERHGNLA
jgi:cystathionine beta-lyase